MLLLAACVGVLIGIVTGITPGLHVNLICTLLLAAYPFLPLTGMDVVVFVIAVAVTHTFLDIIPSIYLGAPDSSTALGVLPGHRYLLQGNGFMAVKLSTLGAFAGLLLGLATFPLFALLTTYLELVPKQITGWVLLAIPVVMWVRERKKLVAALIIVLASVYGSVGFAYTDPLFPMLSGLFGAATLLYSLKESSTIPAQQSLSYTQIRLVHVVQAMLGGLVAGGLTAVLPGLGAAHAAVIGMLLAAGTGDHGFLVLTGTIGTANFFLSLAAFDAIGKARNGALLAATQVQPTIALAAAIGAALFAGGCGVLLTFTLGRKASQWLTILPYQTLTVGVLVFVSSLVLLLNGWTGMLLYGTGCALGLVAAASKAARAHAMSCILVPVAIRFINQA